MRWKRTAPSKRAIAVRRLCDGTAGDGRDCASQHDRGGLERSANTPIGYPMVNVRDIESGKARATRDLCGAD